MYKAVATTLFQAMKKASVELCKASEKTLNSLKPKGIHQALGRGQSDGFFYSVVQSRYR